VDIEIATEGAEGDFAICTATESIVAFLDKMDGSKNLVDRRHF
jgi:hypothetical protein